MKRIADPSTSQITNSSAVQNYISVFISREFTGVTMDEWEGDGVGLFAKDGQSKIVMSAHHV